MVCKNICVEFKAKKPKNSQRYLSGQKRCFICEIFMKWEGIRCPCCGHVLRVKPRTTKHKEKYRIAKNIKYI